jgi:urease accessory protein
LRIARCGSRSTVVRAFARSPLRLLTPSNHGHAAWVFTSTFGGGLLGGDAIALDVQVDEGATALLQTQASTKIYRSRRGASSTLRATVADDAALLIVPDPTVCFAGAGFSQEQHVDLAPGAHLVLVDWITAGRRAAGERWAFDNYESRISIRRGRDLLLCDALSLTAIEGALADRLGRFDCFCTVVVSGPAFRAFAGQAIDAVWQMPAPHRSDLLVSAAPIDDGGCVIRIAGTSVEEVGRAMREHLRFVPALLGDDPWARKW